ncbi:simple sugar transport system permease protein [Angulomicrobium tetraedrale]|uniref:Simple sugar transport system permease protein n=1 Tax=Ancylobacter tetraedralis TaxID=217068 RepID=A0A839ZEF8_9HYPH|nr:ABC transporter permease [Ancylobacter tetraedralis]MBB3773025.1 simple sugar transport system permease protein [Ancylobacter tetraedralis]
MPLRLERQENVSGLRLALAPLLALVFTLIVGAIMFVVLGHDPIRAFGIYFVGPLLDPYTLQELVVKAGPLLMIGTGLAFCYRANRWNIGAEGQYVAGAVVGSWLALVTHGTDAGPWVLPAMLVMGALGGALWGLIPAFLRVRFGSSEILTSLMLVYVAQLGLDYLVRGPWKDPDGFNFPQSVTFDANAVMPLLMDEGRLHGGIILALVAVVVATFVLGRTLVGYSIEIGGSAPRAAAFAGFDERRVTYGVFAVSGALAGLAGIIEVAGPIGNLQPSISPGYGFTAIIAAMLGRLHPVGIVVASLVLALTYIGGEAAQISMRLPFDVTRVFQGTLLIAILAADVMVRYRVRRVEGTSHA